MQLATVHGNATATVKYPAMTGWRMLVVQPLMVDGSPDGFPLLAIDNLGAGVGDTVMLTTDGAAVKEMMKSEASPVRYAIIGIQD
ncbi:EutN/CcmL family microcompartment protein [Rubinisphaera italica]|uniref:Ethanolamine utilization protein EutN n=1 Tax=Rubinisphaera italica TaxID=2527969 RepID=A0A5C5XNJ4_9PLAN|nr:EutN/CcmL family microcompartment protein [Rubinisphaera italica]TWT63943.1 Ethanolamine utilization protein EutN [Rubinisphaera italica]